MEQNGLTSRGRLAQKVGFKRFPITKLYNKR